MSAAAATDANAAPPKAAGKKKLIIIVAVLAVLLAGGGGAAFYMMKKKAAEAAAAAEEEEGEDAKPAKKGEHKADAKTAPTFVPLDPFTVNLADRDAERYAQVGMTLELTDPKAGDLLKAYMPAIRNNILLVLAGKTAGELMEHEGKVKLAAEVRAAALKPLGYEIEPAEAHEAPAAEEGKKPKKKAKKDEHADETPVRAVHFSNFIIQ